MSSSAASLVKEVVKTSNAPLPIGPYNQAIKCGGLVYISGCIGMLPETGNLVTGGVEEEALQVMKNMQAGKLFYVLVEKRLGYIP
jgi:2-iminobutanoate/2-iminopropanoate deaminase